MVKSNAIPLSNLLIPGESEPVYGQLEISLINRNKIKITIIRKPYTGHTDIKFTIPSSNLQLLIDTLQEAQMKLDETWLSRVATIEFTEKNV